MRPEEAPPLGRLCEEAPGPGPVDGHLGQRQVRSTGAQVALRAQMSPQQKANFGSARDHGVCLTSGVLVGARMPLRNCAATWVCLQSTACFRCCSECGCASNAGFAFRNCPQVLGKEHRSRVSGLRAQQQPLVFVPQCKEATKALLAHLSGDIPSVYKIMCQLAMYFALNLLSCCTVLGSLSFCNLPLSVDACKSDARVPLVPAYPQYSTGGVWLTRLRPGHVEHFENNVLSL